MDCAHSLQVIRQYYTASLNQEPRVKKERTTEKHAGQRSESGSRRRRNWKQLETVGEIGSELECLAE